jgi:hypothetical protein
MTAKSRGMTWRGPWAGALVLLTILGGSAAAADAAARAAQPGLAAPAPLHPDTTPAAIGSNGHELNGCTSRGPDGFIRLASGVRLNVRLATSHGVRVRAQFLVRDLSEKGKVVASPASRSRSASGAVSTAIGLRLRDGHEYGWQARTMAGQARSKWSGTCRFWVDTSAPAALQVSSASFPPGGLTIVGVAGSVQFSATDPVPAGCKPHACAASTVSYFEYSLDNPIPASGKLPGTGTGGIVAARTVSQRATGTLNSLTIATWGPHHLYVEAFDHAGNHSPQLAYGFYVPDGWTNTLHFPMPGDIDGDDVPDLLATTSAGGLDLYPGSAASSTLPAAVNATASDASPDGGNDWNQFLISHRGSLVQGPDDDVYAQRGIALYIYENNPASPGAAPQFGSGSADGVFRPACSATADNPANCTGYGSTWSSVGQLLAVGDPFPNAFAADAPPSVLTIENGQLWLFPGQAVGLGSPVQLGASGWSGMTLIAPGFIDGQLTVWVRDDSTGTVYSFPILIDANGLPTLSAAHPGSSVTPAQGTVLPGISLPAAQYPAIASPGDAAGLADLYTVDAGGKVWLFSGTLTGLNPAPKQIGSVPAGSIQQLS